MEEFDIIEYMSGLTGFVLDKAVLKRIALDRGVSEVTSYEELDTETKELLLADLLLVAYLSPNTMASSSQSHGSYSKSVGSQVLYDKEKIYNMLYSIYRKYDDEKLEEVLSAEGTLEWLPDVDRSNVY